MGMTGKICPLKLSASGRCVGEHCAAYDTEAFFDEVTFERDGVMLKLENERCAMMPLARWRVIERAKDDDDS